MAGTRLTFTIDDQQARAMLDRLQHLDTTPLMRRLGERIQASTQDRFDEQKAPDGRTPWAALNTKYAKTKPKHNRNKILTFSGDLRDGIRWQVLDGRTVLVGSNAPYAATHQFGREAIPARPFLGISAKDEGEIREIVMDWVRGHGA